MLRLTDVTDKVLSNFPDAEIDLIEKAYVYSAKVHKGQIRLNGEPYLTHPMEVAGILADMRMDVASVATGLLHDTVEDTYASIKEIEENFNEEIASLVNGVTKISRIEFSSPQERQAENYRKMILAMAKDIRVILIKLADRLHNMRTLQFHPPEKQREIARETLDIYAQLSNRLGIEWMRIELEDLAFKFINPEAYTQIKEESEKLVLAGRGLTHEVVQILKNELGKHEINSVISSRRKHLFSIYRKMIRQNIDIEEVYDLVAIRILVDSQQECYEALGVIHSLWKPIVGRFKDYIAVPKANGYQSLHTTVVGPEGRRVEIQIRTHDMHKIDEEGIAAHWLYKEGKEFDKSDEQKFTWLRQLIEWQKDIADPQEFLNAVKVDLFPEEVLVFTPRGDVKSFPRGATIVDFAYSIHSELGQRCVGGKIDGRLLPLKYELKNGDRIEIVTSAFQHPSRDWLSFVKTTKARTRIRNWLATEEKEQSIEFGRKICEKEFRKQGLNFNKYLNSDDLKNAGAELGFHSVEDLLAGLGYGKISIKQLMNKLLQKEEPFEKRKATSPLTQIVRRIWKKEDAVKIRGVDNVMVKFARCCDALPGDEVVGFITRGQGVTIHRANCPRLLASDPERRLAVEWKSDIAEQTFPIDLLIQCADKRGLLADMTKKISLASANITEAKVQTQDGRASCQFTIEVKDLHHLRQVMNSLQKIKGVINVQRLKE